MLALHLIKGAITDINKGVFAKSGYNFLESYTGNLIIRHFDLEAQLSKICPKYSKWKENKENRR